MILFNHNYCLSVVFLNFTVFNEGGKKIVGKVCPIKAVNSLIFKLI